MLVSLEGKLLFTVQLQKGPGSRRGKGFTLIELLAVIAIIGLLAALLMTAVAAMSKRGKQAKCTANLRAIAGGVSVYAAEHNGELPPNTSTGNINAPRVSTWGAHVTQPAMKMSKAPSWFTDAGIAFHAPAGIMDNQEVFYPPSQSEFRPDPDGWFRQENGTYRIGYVWYYFDRAHMEAGGAWWSPLLPYANSRFPIERRVPIASSFGVPPVFPNPGGRTENSYINVLFTDGSVRSFDRKELTEGVPEGINPTNLARVLARMTERSSN